MADQTWHHVNLPLPETILIILQKTCCTRSWGCQYATPRRNDAREKTPENCGFWNLHSGTQHARMPCQKCKKNTQYQECTFNTMSKATTRNTKQARMATESQTPSTIRWLANEFQGKAQFSSAQSPMAQLLNSRLDTWSQGWCAKCLYFICARSWASRLRRQVANATRIPPRFPTGSH